MKHNEDKKQPVYKRRVPVLLVCAAMLVVAVPQVVMQQAVAYGPQCDPGTRGPLLRNYENCTPCERAQDLQNEYANGAAFFAAVGAGMVWIPFLQPAAAIAGSAAAASGVANRYYASQAAKHCS